MRCTARSWMVALWVLIASRAPAQPISSPLWGDLEPGSYAVGFRVENQRDDTRRSSGPAVSSGRPLQICLWYPVRNGPAPPPMLYREYIDTLTRSDPPGLLTTRERQWAFQALRFSINSVDPHAIESHNLEALAQSQTAAARGASPASGRVPLLLWGVRDATAVSQSVLSEYLASHGYDVLKLNPEHEGAQNALRLLSKEEEQKVRSSHE